MRFEKVVCTGGSGRLGSYVAEDLRQHCALTVLDVKPSPAPGVQYMNASITDFAALKKAFQGQDAVVHLAAIPNPDYFRKNPLASVLDISRAQDVLGFEPTSDWRRMVAATKSE